MLIHRPSYGKRSGDRADSTPFFTTGRNGAEAEEACVLWETCLRRLLIGHSSDFASVELRDGDEVYTEKNAYRFLLEILCGLHSKVLGENEIVGQFKKRFLQSPLSDSFRFHFSRLPQLLLADMKKVRAEYPLNSGNHSYGSFVRKEKLSNRVTLLGSGELAQAILPWIDPAANPVQVLYRSEATRARFQESLANGLEKAAIRYSAMSESGLDLGGTVVIAAPLSAREIADLFGKSARRPDQVIDFRGDCASDPLRMPSTDLTSRHEPSLLDLNDFFRQAKAVDEVAAARREVVVGVVAELADARLQADSIQIRTQGWEDLCG